MLNFNLFIIADQCHFIIWVTLYLILLDLAFGGIKKAAPFPWIRANIVHDPMYSPIAGTRYVKRTCPKIMYISKVYITSQLQQKQESSASKRAWIAQETNTLFIFCVGTIAPIEKNTKFTTWTCVILLYLYAKDLEMDVIWIHRWLKCYSTPQLTPLGLPWGNFLSMETWRTGMVRDIPGTSIIVHNVTILYSYSSRPKHHPWIQS